jgi:pimeloyl-ACP methyl ester carboxylesterase
MNSIAKGEAMQTIPSKDGTAIAFDRFGEGPALIMVTGALATRSDVIASTQASAGASLSQHFTVFAYDRRGRGESGDTQPYAVEREVEDIDALITEAGGAAFVFGHSSGAVLALEAARLLPTRITKLAVYEPPFIIDASRPPVPQNYLAQLKELTSSGHRGEAVAYFMTTGVGVPAEEVAKMRNAPIWPALEASAHTLVYDGLIMGDSMDGNPSSIQHWAAVTAPTLVMDGGASPEFMHHGAEVLVDTLPHAQHRRFPGQGHGAANEVLVPALVEFFKDGEGT